MQASLYFARPTRETHMLLYCVAALVEKRIGTHHIRRHADAVPPHPDAPYKMDIREFEIPDVKLLLPKQFSDRRGYFSEIWSDRKFRQQVADVTFVQDNQSFSAKAGTLRGLHFQQPPHSQGKLVYVARGSIFEVAVDIRKGSPTYKWHVTTRLDAADGGQFWVPSGFLHGFCTLKDETVVLYKVTSYYSREHDAGVIWNDPDLDIPWPVDASSVVLSDKDRSLPRLRDLPGYFEY